MVISPTIDEPWYMHTIVEKIVLYVLVLIVLCITGVGCGVQHGRFSSSRVQGGAFSNQVGCITVVDGYELGRFGGAKGQEQNLLYLIIIGPDVPVHGGSVDDDFGTLISTFNRTWETSKGQLASRVQWDRQADTVVVGKQKFDREKGNVFVVQLNVKGEVVCRQLASLGPDSSFQQVLDHARQQLPNDEQVRRLTLKASSP
jgi:hypothetical protein